MDERGLRGLGGRRSPRRSADASILAMADAADLNARLERIGTQLDWVRGYL
jgi:hypothetical protein